MKRLRKKRCKFCHQWFTPHLQAPHQSCCSGTVCRKKRKALAAKNWWLNNPKYAQGRKPKIKTWAKNYPDYWHRYRKEHPDYVTSDGRRRCSSYRRRRISAKQDSMVDCLSGAP
ncbi:hypothetical protein HZB07_00560 [Candidatus Saganbacteria bacterium]|nr:hypothetical protein [Candidatus Saganbacteria bacterium]